MNSADYVLKLIENLKSEKCSYSEIAWKAALACEGWAYVFGARGALCTPSNRRSRASSDHPTIKSACKNFEGTNTCTGCKWYPKEQRTRFFDCRGFTYWILEQVYGFVLQGAGATSQWNESKNWSAKGEISNMPRDTLVCLFVQKGNVMEHTGFGLNDETIECSNGVQHFTKRNKKWTHWAVPICIDGKIEIRPTLKRGSKGEYVSLLQTKLYQLGYPLKIDGIFGKDTEKYVREFQSARNLKVDGIVGTQTWGALDTPNEVQYYIITIPHLTLEMAKQLTSQYLNAYAVKE